MPFSTINQIAQKLNSLAEEVRNQVLDANQRRSPNNLVSALDVAPEQIQDVIMSGDFSFDISEVTPESLFAFLQSSLNQIDKQVSDMMRQINNRNKELSKIRAQLNKLNSLSNQDSIIYVTEAGHRKLETKDLDPESIYNIFSSNDIDLKDVAQTLEYFKDDPLRYEAIKKALEEKGLTVEELKQKYPNVDADSRIGPDYTKNDKAQIKDLVNNAIKSLNNKIKDLSDGSDMEMIKLQDLMSKRSNRIQMTTNILKKLNDANDAVVGNLR